jgi:hypothetical protein
MGDLSEIRAILAGLRRFRRGRGFVALAGAALVASASPPAGAQSVVQGVALDQFDPAPVGDLFFGVPSPVVGGDLIPRAALTFEYAHKPLRLVSETAETAIVASQGFLRLDASLALWDRVLVSAGLPFALIQSGEDPPGSQVSFNPPSSPELGDLRLGARGRLVGADASPFQLALGGYLFLPTAGSGSYAGDGSARGSIHAVIGGRLNPAPGGVAWTASGGVMFRGSNKPMSVTFGAGIAALPIDDLLELSAEMYGSRSFGETTLITDPGGDVVAPAGTSLELLGGVRARFFNNIVVGVGAGPGLAQGLGTPTFRVVGLLGWSPLPPVPEVANTALVDRDNDGFSDNIDACPDKKGELQGDPGKDGCPIEDRDNDTVLDADDACPSHRGVRTLEPLTNGCPKDSDEDGIHDGVDACPNDKGPRLEDAKKNGCPIDTDGDKIPDGMDACPADKGIDMADPKLRGCPEDQDGDGVKLGEDACPRERGAASPDSSQTGCPKLVRLVGDDIVILRPIEIRVSFKVLGGEIIDTASEDVLREVIEVIRQHPEFLKVEVQGHTDDTGSPKVNLEKSQARAELVKRWLVDAGMPADKLVAKGYGHIRPIADNRQPEGRQKNRRIAFSVVERAK